MHCVPQQFPRWSSSKRPQYTAVHGILHTGYRLSSPRDSQEPLLQSVRMGGGQAQHRPEHMRHRAANSMGGVQTIIM
jgi:hypothetical protein